MKLNKAQINLTKEDVISLCDAAELAWKKASPRARKVSFLWRKKRYISRCTNFRMLVHTSTGEPVACRWP